MPLRASLLQALSISCRLREGKLPASPVEVAQQFGLPLDAMLFFGVVLDKRDAAEFLCQLGFSQSPALIEKQLLKEGRYRERFHRDVSTFKNRNIYSYAELLAIIERPLLNEKFSAEVVEANLPS